MPATMRAAVITAPTTFHVAEVPLPTPGPGEVRFRVEGCGVCASNLPPWEGRPWFTYPLAPGGLGHEGWGRVDALGAGVRGWAVGDRVAALSQHAYAEWDVAPADALVPLPPELGPAPFPGEPLGCAVNIFRRAEVRAGDTVAVVGVGFLGALLIQLAVAAGARVIAVARREWARGLATRMGAHQTVAMDDRACALEEIGALTGGRWCDVVIECTGKQEPLDVAGELTGERRRLVIAGYHQDGLRQVNLQLWGWRGLDVINAHERDPAVYRQGMVEAAALVGAGSLRPAELYTHHFPLDRLGEALTLSAERPDGFLKALVVP